MTNEQLTQEIMNLKEHQAKSEAEHEKFEMILSQMQNDIKSTKTLAEDVHIMAINMKNMQATLEETSQKVDSLSQKDFVEYKENKKIIKQNIISKVSSVLTGAIITGIAWSASIFLGKQ